MDWRKRLLSFSDFNPEEIIRHGIAQKDYVFDCEKLEAFVKKISNGYSIKAFDEELYNSSLNEEWAEEFCDTFSSYEEYRGRGFGYGVIKDGVLVAGASTMTVYNEGFEVQVATKELFRGQGLALAASAALLLEGQRRGLRACWDADNEASLHIALKLGYDYMGEYSTVRLYRP
jgi:GNAT superfamily N-acetyltransferase